MLDERTVSDSTWTLLLDPNTEQVYYWNTTFHYSVWKGDLFPFTETTSAHTNDQIWTAFLSLQRKNIYKQCAVCRREITRDSDFCTCTFCGSTVHRCCFSIMRHACRFCSPKGESHGSHLPTLAEDDRLSSMMSRIKTLKDDFSPSLKSDFRPLRECNGDLLKWKDIVTRHFQGAFCDYTIQPIKNKGNTLGVIATHTIKPYTKVGIYPGYPDPLCAYQCKYGRPIPQFLLEKNNCADYTNRIFEEFDSTLAPYVNEPNLYEKANCGWLIQTKEGRTTYSLLTVRTIQTGEELMIGYGPSFQRDYKYNYDHYVFIPTSGEEDERMYNLIRWKSDDAEDSQFICNVNLEGDRDEAL